jgi:hypothetical protein
MVERVNILHGVVESFVPTTTTGIADYNSLISAEKEQNTQRRTTIPTEDRIAVEIV